MRKKIFFPKAVKRNKTAQCCIYFQKKSKPQQLEQHMERKAGIPAQFRKNYFWSE
jgi:hypothetical protein